MKSVKDFNVNHKKVLVRCDFNVPIDDDGNISDDFRIQKTLPTLQYLIHAGAKIIIMAHLGEPEGNIVDMLKLDNIKERLQTLLGRHIIKTDDCVGGLVKRQVLDLTDGQILMLENLRFHKEETDNDREFAKELASFGDLYINDAFGNCHRAHASMVSVPTFLPRGAGLLLEQEISNLSKILNNPQKPLVVLVGGAKAATKAKFIENISRLADSVLVNELIKKEIAEKKLKFSHPEKIIKPIDGVDHFDLGENTIKMFKEKILQAKTVVWNGPFGKFEEEKYKSGTLELAKAIIESGAFSVVGGGETIEFLNKEGIIDKFSHVSTGGGAMLEFLAGDTLPGIEALETV